jgi:hypothetical protein
MNREELIKKHLNVIGVNVMDSAEKHAECSLQAMQEQAVAFAEWIVSERWKIEFKQQRHFTTAELYTLFNTNNTNNGE